MSNGIYIDENKKKHPLYTKDFMNHKMIGELLIEKMLAFDKKSINQQDEFGKTALHYAITNKHQDSAIYLLSTGMADTDIKDNSNNTPLSEFEAPLYPRKLRQKLLESIDGLHLSFPPFLPSLLPFFLPASS